MTTNICKWRLSVVNMKTCISDVVQHTFPTRTNNCTATHKHHVNDKTHTHTHPFNGPFSRTTWVCWYQKGKTNLDFTEARDSGISWATCKSAPCSRQKPHQHLTTQFFTGRMPFLPPNQQRQSIEGICHHRNTNEMHSISNCNPLALMTLYCEGRTHAHNWLEICTTSTNSPQSML